jgi:hypothetical protein
MNDKPNARGDILKRTVLSSPSCARSLPVICLRVGDYIINHECSEKEFEEFLSNMDEATYQYISSCLRSIPDDQEFRHMCHGVLEIGRGN